jgi:hypothetical protein
MINAGALTSDGIEGVSKSRKRAGARASGAGNHVGGRRAKIRGNRAGSKEGKLDRKIRGNPIAKKESWIERIWSGIAMLACKN